LDERLRKVVQGGGCKRLPGSGLKLLVLVDLAPQVRELRLDCRGL
jgi:hypothetical protein